MQLRYFINFHRYVIITKFNCFANLRINNIIINPSQYKAKIAQLLD